MWLEGTLSVDEHAVHVEPSDGKRRQSYRLFDHVTVTIQLSKCSDVHARSLAFYLLSKRPLSTDAKYANKVEDVKISKMDFLQEIKKDQQKMEPHSIEKDEQEDNSMKKSNSAVKEKKSMYRFFEDMKTLGETKISK